MAVIKIINLKEVLLMKKGQGLSLNTIIIAAIVLIVLIVLWAIFTGRMGGFTRDVGKQDAAARIQAAEIAAEARGSGCIYAKACADITAADKAACIAIGCVDHAAGKCTGIVPDKCVEKTITAACTGFGPAGSCRWIGPNKP